MLLDTSIQSGFHFIKIIHYIVSIAFLVNAVWVLVKSAIGILKGRIFSRLDRYLSFGFITNLYIQLIFGIILFANLGSSKGYEYISADGTVSMVSKRLWPVEHIVLMLFALFIANLGLILALKTEEEKEKHKRILIYYSVSIFLIAFSLSAIYLF